MNMTYSLLFAGLLLVSAQALQVHIVPHTHDDPGWLKTVDQYYYGSNDTIYQTGVQYILDTVTQQLADDPKKTFTYVEMSFFQRWYTDSSAITRARVKKLVKAGQLSFANGGWSMHDEASTHFNSMIDQTTLGHRFLNEEFGFKPRVGWQIDPFGHSATNAWLMSAEVGFDALYFGRINYDDRESRAAQKKLEFVWQASPSRPDSTVFTGVFSDGNYQPPPGICFDLRCPETDPVMADSRLKDYNLDKMTDTLIQGIEEEAGKTNGDTIMLKMGSDFHYQNAIVWYKSLDLLIESVNAKRPDLNLFYSTPESYTLAKNAENIDWTTKLDDFFPYRDCAACNWAGYYTSRPGVKRLERLSSSVNQIVKQKSASLMVNPAANIADVKQSRHAMVSLETANGVVNHHDAITGTAKQHVTDDWMQTLSRGLAAGEDFIAQTLAKEVNTGHLTNGAQVVCRYTNESVCDATTSARAGDSFNVLAYNPLARSTSQQVTVLLGDAAGSADVAVTGPNSDAAVIPSQILSVAPDPSAGTIDRNGAPKATYQLVFEATNVPALGHLWYTVSLSKRVKPEATKTAVRREVRAGDADVTITNGEVSVTFSASTGLMTRIQRSSGSDSDGASQDTSWQLGDRKHSSLEDAQKAQMQEQTPIRSNSDNDDIDLQVKQDLQYYRSWQPGAQLTDKRDPHQQNLNPPAFALSSADLNVDGTPKGVGSSSQPSGAYIFRSSTPNEKPTSIRNSNSDRRVALFVTQGELVSEVHQVFSDWATQTVRVRKDSALIEVEWTTGEVPVSDGWGKEIISTIDASASLKNTGATVYTDSNAREFMPRVRDMQTDEFVAGNYYPLSVGAYIKDDDMAVQMSILVDRGEGCASLKDGEMEIMLNRRLLVDDWRGVGEALNETTKGMTPYPDWQRQGKGITVSGKYNILVSTLGNGMQDMRFAMDDLYLPLYTTYTAPSMFANALSTEHSSLVGYDLPRNVHLLTLQAWSDTQLLVRVSHQFAMGEDENYSKDVSVDMNTLLSAFSVVAMTEMSLSANMEKTEMEARRLTWTHSDVDHDNAQGQRRLDVQSPNRRRPPLPKKNIPGPPGGHVPGRGPYNDFPVLRKPPANSPQERVQGRAHIPKPVPRGPGDTGPIQDFPVPRPPSFESSRRLVSDNDGMVSLSPMQVRTYLVDLDITASRQ